jgi:hypothetical protein
LFFLCIFCAGNISAAEDKKINFDSFMYSGFITINTFSSIDVYLQGTAEDIGLSKEELTDYLRMRFKNSFANLEFKETDFGSIWNESNEERAKRGIIEIKIWTVGDDYPIAFHIEIRAGNYAGDYSNMSQYKSAILGYDSKSKIQNTTKESISELVDELAVSFFKARGEI